MEIVMDNLKESFEDVADWCEKHLEGQQGREIGMTFGAMLRAYGRLATLSPRLHGAQRTAKEGELNAKAESLLMQLSTRLLVAHQQTRVESLDSISMRTNMTYDTGSRPQE